ncbi:MAG: rod-binding protein [Spirochaetes bacterium]|nr:rod-binding protein [Spirochaetota bacterium]
MNISGILTSGNQLPESKSNDVSVNNDKVSKFKQLLDRNLKSNEFTRFIPQNNNKPVDKKLMDVCLEMESIFVSRMLKEMRNTLPKEKLIDGGYAEKIFEDMLYDDYSLTLSKTSNLGLAGMLYSELSKI